MRFRALVYLAVLISLGFLTACSTKNSSSTGGTGALFVTTQGDNLITPYMIDLSTGKFTANGKAVATDSMPSAVVLSPKGVHSSWPTAPATVLPVTPSTLTGH